MKRAIIIIITLLLLVTPFQKLEQVKAEGNNIITGFIDYYWKYYSPEKAVKDVSIFEIILVDEDFNVVDSTKPSKDGSYRFSNVPNGTYYIGLNHNKYKLYTHSMPYTLNNEVKHTQLQYLERRGLYGTIGWNISPFPESIDLTVSDQEGNVVVSRKSSKLDIDFFYVPHGEYTLTASTGQYSSSIDFFYNGITDTFYIDGREEPFHISLSPYEPFGIFRTFINFYWNAENFPITSEDLNGELKAASNIKIFINDKEFKQSPVVKNGRAMLPFRDIFEALGARVMWDTGFGLVVAEKEGGEPTIVLKPGSNRAYVDFERYILDVEPFMINGTTYVPLRFVSDALDVKIVWDKHENTIRINNH